MAHYTDQLGRKIELTRPPQRIVSLVPSQTELLYHLGLNQEVRGITKFCVHPIEWFKTKTRIGGTKQLDLDKIRSMRPDLIIANKEENMQDQVESLAQDFAVWTSNINNLGDALSMIRSVAAITDREQTGEEIASRIEQAFSGLEFPAPQEACYLIWRNPYMTVGGDTFISDMMARAGFINRFRGLGRYPGIDIEAVRGCNLLLLSSEPYPFARKHVEELQPLLAGARILLVDGEMFSWYGSRLLEAPAYFRQVQNEILSLSHAAGDR